MSWAFRITNNLKDKEKSICFAAASNEERKVCLNVKIILVFSSNFVHLTESLLCYQLMLFRVSQVIYIPYVE